MSVLSKSTWQRKLEVYGKVGWSKDEILLAFKKLPSCMIISDKKIKRIVEFVVKELEIKVSNICRYPNLLLLTFGKRIVLRFAVMRFLMPRNLIKKNLR